MTSNTNWKQSFFGREELMSDLLNIWNKINDSGPQFIILKGEPGAGKTRVLQELFHQISTTSDPDGYWPDNLQVDGKNLKVFSANPKEESKKQIPWLWFPLRFQAVTERNNSEVDGALSDASEMSKPHIDKAIHQEGLIAYVRSKINDVLSSMGELAVGNLDVVPELVSSTADAGGVIASVCKGLVKHYKATHDSATKTTHESNLDMSAQLVRGLTKLLDRKSPMPVVLVLDDLSFLNDNGSSNVFLHKLFQEVKKRGGKWPLIVISTVHPLQWKTNDNSVEHAGQILYKNFKNQFAGYEYNLDEEYQLIASDLRKIICESGLSITDEQSNAFIERADGNPLVLCEMLVDGLNSTRGCSELKKIDFNEIKESSNTLINSVDKRLKLLNSKERSMLYASAFQGERFSIAMVFQAFSENIDKGDTSLVELTAMFGALHEDTLIIDKPHNETSEFTQRSHWEAVNKKMEVNKNVYIEQFEKFLKAIDVEKDGNLTSDMLEKSFNISVKWEIKEGSFRKLLGRLIVSLVEQSRFIDALPIVSRALRVDHERNGYSFEEIKVDAETNLEELIAIFTTCAGMGFKTYNPDLAIACKDEKFEDKLLVDRVDTVIRALDFDGLSDVDRIRIYTEILSFYASISWVHEEAKYSRALAKFWRDYIDSKADRCSINEISDGFRCNVQYAYGFFRFNAKELKLKRCINELIKEEFFDIFEWMSTGPCPLLEEKGGEYKGLAEIYAILSTAIMQRFGDRLWKNFGDENLMKSRPKEVILRSKFLFEYLDGCEGLLSEHAAWPTIFASTLLVDLTLLLEKETGLMSENLVALVLDKSSTYLNAVPVLPMYEMIALVDMCNIFQNWARVKGLSLEGVPEIPSELVGKVKVRVLKDDEEAISKVPSNLRQLRKDLSGSSQYYGDCYPYMSMNALAIVTDVEELCWGAKCDASDARSAMADIIKMIKVSREEDRFNYGEVCELLKHAFYLIKSLPAKANPNEVLAALYNECSECDTEKLDVFKEEVFSDLEVNF